MIGRFLQRERERIEGVFNACMRRAYEVWAVEETKVAAEVNRKLFHREELEEILRRLDKVAEEKRGEG